MAYIQTKLGSNEAPIHQHPFTPCIQKILSCSISRWIDRRGYTSWFCGRVETYTWHQRGKEFSVTRLNFGKQLAQLSLEYWSLFSVVDQTSMCRFTYFDGGEGEIQHIMLTHYTSPLTLTVHVASHSRLARGLRRPPVPPSASACFTSVEWWWHANVQ